jgi:hypothetical protein
MVFSVCFIFTNLERTVKRGERQYEWSSDILIRGRAKQAPTRMAGRTQTNPPAPSRLLHPRYAPTAGGPVDVHGCKPLLG